MGGCKRALRGEEEGSGRREGAEWKGRRGGEDEGEEEGRRR